MLYMQKFTQKLAKDKNYLKQETIAILQVNMESVKCLSCNENHSNKTDDNEKIDSGIHFSFLIKIINLFGC